MVCDHQRYIVFTEKICQINFISVFERINTLEGQRNVVLRFLEIPQLDDGILADMMWVI